MYQAWQLAAIDDAGYNGIRDSHIEKLARAIEESGVCHVGNEEFEYFCRKCGMDSGCFTQEDVDRLERRLNG